MATSTFLWDDAVEAYLSTHRHIRSRGQAERVYERLSAYLSGLPLEHVHDRALDQLREDTSNLKSATVNRMIEHAQRALNHAATYIPRGQNTPMLRAVPKLTRRRMDDVREPHELTPAEEAALLPLLPGPLADLVRLALLTGMRHAEISHLDSSWIENHEEGPFIRVPRERAKNGKSRVVPLCESARVLKPRRQRMTTPAWQKARAQLGLDLTVHDLRHTFACRIRAKGVEPWTIGAILGHTPSGMVYHYARPSRGELMAAVRRLEMGKQ